MPTAHPLGLQHEIEHRFQWRHQRRRNLALLDRRGAHDVNKSLSALSGQVLESLRFSVTPGGQRLVVTTDECQVALTIDRAGVHLERLEL